MQLAPVAFECGIDHNPSDPAFKGAFAAELFQLPVNLDESLLKYIAGVVIIIRILKAQSKHSVREHFVQLFLALPVTLQAAIDYIFKRVHQQISEKIGLNYQLLVDKNFATLIKLIRIIDEKGRKLVASVRFQLRF